MNKKEVYVVPHSHWDAEWYFTCEDSHILLVENLDYLIELLETDPQFPSYSFDGLAIILEEYLQIRPENEERLKALIKQKRLFVGPWYTQCDSLLIRSESLVRNLLYGVKKAEEFGHSMDVGYLPDIFGQHAYLPSIFKDMGIRYSVLQRGLYTEQVADNLNFYWRSPNQKMIPTNYMYFGYGPGKFLSADVEYRKYRLMPILDKLAEMNTGTDKLLLPAGGDQVLANDSFPGTVAELNQLDTSYHFVMSDFESYMKDVWQETDFDTIIDGELFACQKSRIHRTCHSTRYDIKQQTYITEHLMIDQLEPLASLAMLFGLEYPRAFMDLLWRKIFEAHAHNGIEATNADPVNNDIKMRLVSVERSALSLINLLKKQISRKIVNNLGNENILVVFNCDVHGIDQLVKAVVFTKEKDFVLMKDGEAVESNVVVQEELDGGQIVIVTAEGEKLEKVDNYYRSEIIFPVQTTSGLGYQTYTIEAAENNQALDETINPVIENDLYKITLQNNSLVLQNKKNGHTISDFLAFVDCADDGDEFDFAPLADDKDMFVNEFVHVATEAGSLISKMTLESELMLPKDIAERKAGIASQVLKITTVLELRAGDEAVNIHHQLVNEMVEHRLRVHIKTPIMNPQYSYADQGYSIISRETSSKYLANWRELGFVEKPMPIYTMENIVYLKDADNFLGVMTKGIKEYEVIAADGEIALTLFRSVGLLGKDDTLWRPGRASGINNKVVETPDALMLHEMTFDYAIIFADNSFEDADVYRAISQYQEHYLSYQVQRLNTFEERLERFTLPVPVDKLPAGMSRLMIDNNRVFMSMCKAGATNDECIVRLFNPGEQTQVVNFIADGDIVVHVLTMKEERGAQVPQALEIAAKDYVTVAVRFMDLK